jgi:hypothetical protein
MHIIGKILEGSHRCIFTIKTNAVTGAQKIILSIIKTVVLMSIVAQIVMAGKSKNIILRVSS